MNERENTGTDFVNWLESKLGKRIGEVLGSGSQGAILDMGYNVIKISNKPFYSLQSIVNKDIEGIAKVYSYGSIHIPKRFLKSEDGFGKQTSKDVEVNGVNIRPLKEYSHQLFYLIMEKLHSGNSVAFDLKTIENAITDYMHLFKGVRDFDAFDFLEKNADNAEALQPIYSYLKSDYSIELAELMLQWAISLKNVYKHFNWRDAHVYQFALNSKNQLVAFDLDNSKEKVSQFTKHLVAEESSEHPILVSIKNHKNGVELDSVDVKRVHCDKSQPNKCETNVFHYIHNRPDQKLYPVKGYGFEHNTPIEHWWIYDADHKQFIDITAEFDKYIGIIGFDTREEILNTQAPAHAPERGPNPFDVDFFRSGNLNKFLNESTNVADCEKYFDLDSIDRYVEFDKPLYSIVQKYKTARLLYISPKEYLNRIAKGFGISYKKTITGAEVNSEKAKKYAQRMKDGEKAPVIYYTKNGKYQEGRHRALASMSLGCTRIPVIELQKLNADEVEAFVSKVKDKSFEELNQYFKDNGFENGITNLGWRDMQAFISTNFKTNEIRKQIRTALNEQFILLENLQQADKHFFNAKDYLTPEDREFVLSITGGDKYTFKVSELLDQLLSYTRRQNKSESVETYREMLEEFYNHLQTYNKNLFPYSEFTLDRLSQDIYDFHDALKERSYCVKWFKQLPSIAQRNLKHLSQQQRHHKYQFDRQYIKSIAKQLEHAQNVLTQGNFALLIKKTFSSKRQTASGLILDSFDKYFKFLEENFRRIQLQNLSPGKETVKDQAIDLGGELIDEGENYLVFAVDNSYDFREITCNLGHWCSYNDVSFENHAKIIHEVYIIFQFGNSIPDSEKIIIYTEEGTYEETIPYIIQNHVPPMEFYNINNARTEPFVNIDTIKLNNRVEEKTREHLRDYIEMEAPEYLDQIPYSAAAAE